MFVFDVILFTLIILLDLLVLVLFFSKGVDKAGIFCLLLFPMICITFEAVYYMF